MKASPSERERERTTTNHSKSGRLNDINSTCTLHFKGGRTHVSQLIGDIFDSTAFRRDDEMRWTGHSTQKTNHNHINFVFCFIHSLVCSFVCSLIYFVNYKRWVFITLNIEQRTKRKRSERERKKCESSESISVYYIDSVVPICHVHVSLSLFCLVLSCRTLVAQCSM